MSYSAKFHPSISLDYTEAYEWYEEKEEGLGQRFFDAVGMKINQILLHPLHYSSKGNETFREVSVDVFPYQIVYQINHDKKEIYISSIHHAKKSPKRKYRKDMEEDL